MATLEATLNLQPEGKALLEQVCYSGTFSHTELPCPTVEERKPPTIQDANQAIFEGLVED